ncbi:aminotransferase class I/II-fold pyridoxal phosphate-dependent enzyme [Ornithinibacillus sp. BX22]|uniref:Aminotransferase class I/II-fold pyridoxal phosphate-dependent enzyme n=2 Tax=Ornithinibacillus TaxID=484508 RepID=A0A923L4A8_9BACI|nr:MULTISPECIES: aminotransferase class I/II-fold pyridoxal phosphate-dependent enzyme [Ornithinibacillus]MBC5636228.1 aminotransferase class I/II-fold pyridoxal phosphate-dependent enzyme [Ornithinibacillus hominis]MBS3681068.1 aminotransferase class I/II-fold pyridoxal phosphate-dependent enzyme [Ornithinibacillus massiliensis]
MDLFDKVKTYSRAKDILRNSVFPFHPTIEENNGPLVKMDGKTVVMAGSSDYHGFSQNNRVKEAAIQALSKYGIGNNGSRLHNGTLDLHLELEEKLAKFLGKEAVITFNTGYQTNQGAIVPLIGKNDVIFSDRDNHNSIVQAALISRGTFLNKDQIIRYRHNDMNHLDQCLKKAPDDHGKLIVSDGVFSMSGTVVDLPNMVESARKTNAKIMLDDAHGIGVIGNNGAGTASYYGLDNEVDIIVGTLSKGFGSFGGFIAGSKELIHYLTYTSSAYIFSASLPSANVAAAMTALDILLEEPERIDKIQALTQTLRDGLRSLGYNVPDGVVPIIPIILGDDMQVFKTWGELMEHGVYTNVAVSPAVPEGQQMIRIRLMSTHEEEHIDQILNAFSNIKNQVLVY